MSLSRRPIFAQEFHSSEIKSYSTTNDRSIEVTSSTKNSGALPKSVKYSLQSIFLPAGYPDSVSQDYIQYQIWDTLQAFCSSISHSLATHAVLKGSGVGDAGATALAATIVWMMKDGTGMLGSILFAYFRGSRFDSECKRWRLFADIANDVTTLVDLISAHFQSFFLPIQCFSGLTRSLVGVAGSATRAAFTQHQARRNNLADVSAKDSSQETLVNFFALLVNLVIVPWVVQNATIVWSMFLLLTFLHMFFNYKAVRAVNMEVFNMSRLRNTVEKFLESGDVLTPTEANQAENVWFFIPESHQIKLGVSLSQHKDLLRLIDDQKQQKHLLSLNDGNAIVSLSRGITPLDMIKSAFHAIAVIGHLKSVNDSKKLDIMFEEFVTRCEKVGWSFEKQLLNSDEYRFDTMS